MMERPILFSGPMVRAILDGSKTQTRRVVKGTALEWLDDFAPSFVASPGNALSPYGFAGDHLWVRETWSTANGNGHRTVYRADLGTERWPRSVEVPGDDERIWRPSIHMPRRASRLTLRVTDVRVERLQEITAEDAVAEGVPEVPRCGCEACSRQSGFCPADASEQAMEFAALWDSINGAREGCSWAANPWVWCVSFERLEEDR